MSSLKKCVLRASALFNKWVFWMLNRMSSLCILDITPLLGIYWIVCTYFIPFSRWTLHFLDSSIDCIKAFYHDIVPFIYYVKSFDFWFIYRCVIQLWIFFSLLFTYLFKFLYGIVVALQCCIGVCCIAKWISYNSSVSRSVVSDSLRPHGLWPARLLCMYTYIPSLWCFFLI